MGICKIVTGTITGIAGIILHTSAILDMAEDLGIVNIDNGKTQSDFDSKIVQSLQSGWKNFEDSDVNAKITMGTEAAGQIALLFTGAGEAADAVNAASDTSKIAEAAEDLGDAAKLEVADPSFVDESGKIKWPDNMGFEGDPQLTSLSKGQIIDRYGDESGSFASPKGTPYEQRSLPYIQNENAYHSYEVIKLIDDIQSGKIAAAFNQTGSGTQYLLPDSIENLIEDGYLKEIH